MALFEAPNGNATLTSQDQVASSLLCAGGLVEHPSPPSLSSPRCSLYDNEIGDAGGGAIGGAQLQHDAFVAHASRARPALSLLSHQTATD